MLCSAQTSTSTQDLALLADMLSLPNDGRYAALDLSPEQRRQRTLQALVTQVEALARQNPVLMVFEDAHWSDPTSLEALGRIVDRVASLRVLAFVTFRPEFAPPWIGQPHVTALTLNRLPKRDIEAIIDRVVGNKPLPESIRRDIIERTDGIPLFVEEMTKAVLEAGSEDAARQTVASVPSPQLAVPASLHASLMARLDRLGCGEGGGADRGGDWAGVLARTVGRGGEQAGGGAGIGAGSSRLRLVCCSGKAFRRMRAICSSTPWCRTPLMARCCASRDARFTPASPKPLKANSPRSPKTSRSCWRVTAPRPD